MTEFMQKLQNMTETAQGKIDDIRDAIQDLIEIGRIVREMDWALTEEIWRHREPHGSGHGNSGNGNGQGGGNGVNP
jgi:hypothetical protein